MKKIIFIPLMAFLLLFFSSCEDQINYTANNLKIHSEEIINVRTNNSTKYYYSYNDEDRLQMVKRYTSKLYSFEYEGEKLSEIIHHTGSYPDFPEYFCSYDNDGRLTSLTENTDTLIAFFHHNADALPDSLYDYRDQQGWSVSYDGAGNIIDESPVESDRAWSFYSEVTYDNMRNPYQIFPLAYRFLIRRQAGSNNILSQQYLAERPKTGYERQVSYEYNDRDYPLKRTEMRKAHKYRADSIYRTLEDTVIVHYTYY